MVKIFRFRGFFLFVILLFFTAGFGFAAGDYLYFGGRILPHHFIENINVGDLTPEEAIERLQKTSPEALVTLPRALTYGNKRFPFNPLKIGARPKIAESVENAYFISRQPNYFQQLLFRLRGEIKFVPLSFEIEDSAKFKGFIEGLARKVNAPPKNARFYFTREGTIEIRSEMVGKKVILERTKDGLTKSLAGGELTSLLIVEHQSPRITQENLAAIPRPSRLGTYTTYYGTHDSPNRIHNIMLLAGWVNETILPAGATFSLLSKTGHFTPEEGYREAFVIVGDELVPQYGGGACQIGTTFYNAVQLADLDVLSRANHGIYFSIYPLGRDATIYPPWPDFRFRNNTGQPIVIYAYASRKSLTFQIFGTYTGKKVTFSYPGVYYHHPKPKLETVKMITVEAGVTREVEVKRKVAKKVKAPIPFSTVVTRTVTKNGKVIERETIRSYYKAHGDRDRVKIRRPEPR